MRKAKARKDSGECGAAAVFHTGAGISTSAGIPDFRGPRGVWTMEKRGEKPSAGLSWDDANPTATHMALAGLAAAEYADFVVSQNIDGLHMRSGLPRSKLAELHGNMFVDRCTACRRMVVRPRAADTVGQKLSQRGCPFKKRSRTCRGRLADFVLDWEDELPDADLVLSDANSALAAVNLVLGSTLQIVPAGVLPLAAKRYDPEAKLVIVNLQPTKQDKKADLVIRDYVDNVMKMLFEELELALPLFDSSSDPVAKVRETGEVIEWSQDEGAAKRMKKRADAVDDEYKRRRKEARKRKMEENVLKLQSQSDVKAFKEEVQPKKESEEEPILNHPLKEEKGEVGSPLKERHDLSVVASSPPDASSPIVIDEKVTYSAPTHCSIATE